MHKKIVISAVNLTEAGFLSVLKDCLASFSKIYKSEHLDITVFVHKVELVKEYEEQFKIIEYPSIKFSWIKRIYFEYVQSNKLSKDINPDLWIALHDITPNVTCKQVVYCHNPTPFYNLKGHEIFVDHVFFLMCIFYKYLYKINIKKNSYVIIQQEWLRRKFEEIYHIKTIVAQPVNDYSNVKLPIQLSENRNSKFLFFYPAFPRVAKNFEVLLKAATMLSRTRNDFEVILSTSGNETKHAKKLFASYKHVNEIKFSGRKTREQVFELYEQINCMVFPSNLETWGLPITEFKMFNKPMLLPDLEYAHETLGEFDKVKFFTYDDYNELANYMSLLIDNKLVFQKNSEVNHHYPFFKNWDDLIIFLTKDV